jgi:CubicO group peptidase (beta-lactamase class C family)
MVSAFASGCPAAVLYCIPHVPTSMPMNLIRRNRVHIRRNLDAITDHDPSVEVAPASVGLAPDAAERMWKSVVSLYRSGLHPGIQLVVRRRGQVVLDRAIGYAGGVAGDDPLVGARRELKRDTPICLFSASKAITAMLVHKLAEEGALDLEDRVVDYIPEYGQAGKEDTTIAHLLAHRAGIPRLPQRRPDPSLLWEWDRAVELLCAAKPLHGAGQQQAYHAITAGFILGELIRRVTQQDLRQVLHERFGEPLGARYFNYGLRPEDQPAAARNAFTGAPLLPGIAYIARRALGAEFERVPAISNTSEFMSAVIPAGNIYATADETSRFFEMLLRGGRYNGRQIMAPETVQRAVAPSGRIRLDRTLFVPVRFSMGMVLGEKPLGLYGLNCREAFGHLGFMSIICWADPARDISCALLNTGKTLAPGAVTGLAGVLKTISQQCPRDA